MAVPAPVDEAVPPVVPSPTGSSPTGSSRRILAIVTGCVMLVLVAGAVVLWPGGDDAADDTRSTTQADPVAPGSLRFAPPIPLAVDTEYVETEAISGGDLLVTHWIRTGAPVDQLILNVPTSPALAEQAVDVKQLVIAVDGVLVDNPGVVTEAGWVGDLPAASDVYIHYRLSDILQRSGSAAGRALATVTSLEATAGDQALGRVQAFPGSQVLSLACLPPGSQAVPTPCGTLLDDGWTLESEPGDVPVTVIAQFDLTVR